MGEQEEKKKKYSGFDNQGMINQIEGIIKWLERDIENLNDEYIEVSKMSAPMNRRMMTGINKNIRDRKEDLFDYKNQLHSKIIKTGLK